MTNRQPYPIGDTESGQLVQVSKPIPNLYRYIGKHETITVATTAIGLTEPDAIFAMLTVETAAIRFWVDGNADPSATVGHIAEVGTIIELDTPLEVRNFRAIRRDGTSATLQVSYGYA